MAGKPVVVAVDGSDEALYAAEWAAREARQRSAPLRIVSVPSVLPRMHVNQDAVPTVASMLREVATGAVLQAARLVTEVAPGLIVDTDVLTGAPAIAVTDSGSGAAMLVVGARGAGGFGSMILGSVSRHAAANASCPVIVVHDQPVAARHEVVVGVRDPEDSAPALSFAFEEAALREADLVIIHAWHGLAPGLREADQPTGDPVSAQARRQIADALAPWQEKYPSVDMTVQVVHGHPGHVLSSRSASAELVVLGRHGDSHRSGVRTGVAFVRHSVLGHAHGPVVIVPA